MSGIRWVLVLLVPVVLADIYMHNPRGSNDRLNEKSAQRTNANRLFNSQNNNRGGYNVGDSTAERSDTEEQQYRMKYFTSHENYRQGEGQSLLTIEWTNQHGCGGDEDTDPHKVNCNVVFQYMCQDDEDSATGQIEEDLLRNGQTTQTQDYERPDSLEEDFEDYENRREESVTLEKGLHEDFEYYDNCYVRERNNGLFLADQRLGRNAFRYSSAKYTRQNRRGTRYGYECPEERDYYPYWHPTPWKDIAVLAVDEKDCSYYEQESFNVKPNYMCVEKFDSGEKKPYSRWNNQVDCEKTDENGVQRGTWTLFYNYLELSGHDTESACNTANSNGPNKYIWGIPHDSTDGTTKKCMVALDKPDCQQAPWSRTNHLGNGREGTPLNYTWVLPNFPSGNTKRCVLRARYNISSDDYNPMTTDFKFNGVKSPVRNNPFIDVGAGPTPLRLAINTAQFGRTFQDRTNVFKLQDRTSDMGTATLYNLNVRGKRGNIVQAFPAVEYDFFPNDLTLKVGDMIHAQWEGSNSHNNQAPGGDGQTGDAGQGASGTDRHNLCQTIAPNVSYPLPIEFAKAWESVQTVWIHHTRTGLSAKDLAIGFATAGFYECVDTSCTANPTTKQLYADMNNAPASYPGAVMKMTAATDEPFYYLCSRNNAFTNRSQKGKITVIDSSTKKQSFGYLKKQQHNQKKTRG